MTQNDVFLVKWKSAGMASKHIAAKLGISTAEVDKRWEAIQQELLRGQLNGYNHLVDQFTVLCHQYQLVGESLKIVSCALGNTMTEEELKVLISDNPRVTLENLKASCIILRPFVPINVEKSLEDSLKNTAGGN